MIEELCLRLKEKRKDLDLSIEEVVERTKLHPSAIRDIEDCNLSNLSATYLRGFLKIYASFLGVEVQGNLDDIVAESLKARDQKTVSGTKEFISPELKSAIIIIILLIGVIWGLVIFTRVIARSFSKKDKKPPVKEVIQKPPEPVSQTVQPKKTVATVLPPAPVIEKVPQEIIVALTAKRNCFLRVKVDGKLLFEGILKKGTIESWKAKNDLEFKISDGSAVYLEINGKPLPPLTSIHKPIKNLKITASGISIDK